ncbi:MAG: hypothetical protein ACOYNN_03750, partial [Terrimicrobiaceae bacterium]
PFGLPSQPSSGPTTGGSSGSFVFEAWKRAENPADYKSDAIGEWISLTSMIEEFDFVRYYIGNKIRRDSSTGILETDAMAVTQRRYLVEIVPSQNKFRATPLPYDYTQLPKWREYMPLNEMGEQILKFAKAQLGE